jgi:hypothetical protein
MGLGSGTLARGVTKGNLPSDIQQGEYGMRCYVEQTLQKKARFMVQ